MENLSLPRRSGGTLEVHASEGSSVWIEVHYFDGCNNVDWADLDREHVVALQDWLTRWLEEHPGGET